MKQKQLLTQNDVKMKDLKITLLFALIASIVFITGCKKDDEEVISPFVGNYIISKAAIAVTFTINTNELGVIPIPAGQDITQAIQSSLLSQVTCTSADKTWVELRKDNTMYMSCEGANELNAGTWEEVSATELKLNMNASALPPNGYALSVTNMVSAGNKLSGLTSVPFTKDLIAQMIAAMKLTLADGGPDVYPISFTIEFISK